jgi:HEPN domain-containing protein
MDEQTRLLLKKSASDENVLQFDLISPQIRAFHAQQAIEKLLKAWIAALGGDPPKIHEISRLEDLLKEEGQTLPVTPIPLAEFNEYAADWRYADVPEENLLDDAAIRETVRILREYILTAIAKLS